MGAFVRAATEASTVRAFFIARAARHGEPGILGKCLVRSRPLAKPERAALRGNDPTAVPTARAKADAGALFDGNGRVFRHAGERLLLAAAAGAPQASRDPFVLLACQIDQE